MDHRLLVDGHEVILDDEGLRLFSEFHYKWSFRRAGQNRGNKKYLSAATWTGTKVRTEFFHRLLMGAAPDVIVDHINNDTRDNRRCNLRIVTPSQNSRNQKKRDGRLDKPCSSRFKGVHRAGARRWRSLIRIDGRRGQKHLGYFDTELEAAYAYDMASLEHHGEFGRRNFLPLVHLSNQAT